MPHTVAHNIIFLNSSIYLLHIVFQHYFMKETFFYQHDHASSTPMIIPTEENHNIEEFMRVDLFDSSSHYCDLFEAIAPSQNIASSNQASNTVIDVMSDSSSSIV
jgi:hypothetical protein